MLSWPTFGLGQLYRSAHTLIATRLGTIGEAMRTYSVLAALAEHGELSQQQVCDRIDMGRSDMVRLLDDLETRGHVVRTRDPKDRHRHQVTLTPSGQKSLRRCERLLAAATNEVFSHLSADERRVLHGLVLQTLGHPADVIDLAVTPNRRVPT